MINQHLKEGTTLETRFEIFTKLITRISRNIRRIKTEEVAEFNLKSPHVSCLYYLHKSGKLCSTELAEVCDEDKAAISRTLDYLERQGFISCEEQGKRRYKANFVLTERGKEVATLIAAKIDKVIMIAGEELSDEERDIFYRALEKISARLDTIANN